MSLVVVHILYRFEKSGTVAVLICGLDQSCYILRKTVPTVAATGVNKAVSDARIAANATTDFVYICIYLRSQILRICAANISALFATTLVSLINIWAMKNVIARYAAYNKKPYASPTHSYQRFSQKCKLASGESKIQGKDMLLSGPPLRYTWSLSGNLQQK